MRIWTLWRPAFFSLLLLSIMSLVSAFAAGNTIPITGKLDTTVALTVQQLQPPDCNGLTLATYVVSPGGSYTNNGASALIIGTAGFDSISAGGGNDCIVGGTGGDNLKGGKGGDICFGTNSTIFQSCAAAYTTLRP
jgi:Ca2+-binding RTX toxin-like protein